LYGSEAREEGRLAPFVTQMWLWLCQFESFRTPNSRDICDSYSQTHLLMNRCVLKIGTI
jgi:hypothetical protein